MVTSQQFSRPTSSRSSRPSLASYPSSSSHSNTKSGSLSPSSQWRSVDRKSTGTTYSTSTRPGFSSIAIEPLPHLNTQALNSPAEIEVDPRVHNTNARLANPLAGLSPAELVNNSRRFAIDNDLIEYEDVIGRGALVAQDPTGFEDLPELSEEDKVALRLERDKKWSQPWTLYRLVFVCSLAAAVQGADEAVVSGASLFFQIALGIPATSTRNHWLLGLVVSAPYLCSAVLGCWLVAPANHFFGRRGAIFLSSLACAASCTGQFFAHSWQQLFGARFTLGLGMGLMAATTPIYVAEAAPAAIRGAMTVSWQMWTAFGIMYGYIISILDQHATAVENWRVMLLSPGAAALGVAALVYTSPDSPRWLIYKRRYTQAFASLRKLRKSEIAAARDLYLLHVLLEAEAEVTTGLNPLVELFTVGRNARALVASSILMFFQQASGLSGIVYYSSSLFRSAGYSYGAAFTSSLTFGFTNWVFSIPAVRMIDTFGRRKLLLYTFPLLSITLVIVAIGFAIHSLKARLALVTVGLHLYAVAYAPGEGPVPWTYAAEAFPLYVRDYGMSFATAVNWFFNFMISLTFPTMLKAFGRPGVFAFFAVWNVIGFFAVFLFVPETKACTLEELDQVFSVDMRKHAWYNLRHIWYWSRKHILRQKEVQKEELYNFRASRFEMYKGDHWSPIVRRTPVEKP